MTHSLIKSRPVLIPTSDGTIQSSKPARLSYWITTASFFIALAAFIIAPIMAIKWSQTSFPGFVFEQSGVVSNIGRQGWSGRDAGIDYPQRITLVDNQPITKTSAITSLLQSMQTGRGVTIQTTAPNGLKRFYSYVEIQRYQVRDLLRFFWLPYFIGLVYLLIGGAIYLLRGQTQAGLSFAFFCVCTSIVSALSFDISTTHTGTALWTTAISMMGGAIIGLALLFPHEIESVRRRSFLRIFTYIISIGLTIWGWLALYVSKDPWAYVIPWRMSYFYTAFGLVVLVAMLSYRMQKYPSPVERQQIRIILLGSLVAFIVICTWLILPMLKVFLAWDPVIFMPLILLFPLSVAIAIFRYRLWAINVIVRRTLIYGLLTAALGIIYFVSVVLLSELFKLITGQTSSLAGVISTLIIVSLFTPLRKRVQNYIDRRLYRRQYNAEKALAAFAEMARDEVDLEILRKNILEIVQETVQPEHVGLWLKNEEK